VTCAAPMQVYVLGTVTQNQVSGDFEVVVDCTPERAATWTATVSPEGGAPFVKGRAKVDLQAFAYLSPQDVTIDDHSRTTVHLTRA
jgi:hypothetical protein